MALNIEFEGYVNEVKTFDWGTVAKVSHSQRAKNDATGQWETVSKDYLDVTLPQGALVTENSLIRVVGTFKVSTFDKRDGSTGVAIKVRAKSVEPVERTFATSHHGTGDRAIVASAPAQTFVEPAGWETVPEDDGLPF